MPWNVGLTVLVRGTSSAHQTRSINTSWFSSPQALVPPNRAAGPLSALWVRVSEVRKEDQMAATALLSSAGRASHSSVIKEMWLTTIFWYLSFYLQALSPISGHLAC